MTPAALAATVGPEGSSPALPHPGAPGPLPGPPSRIPIPQTEGPLRQLPQEGPSSPPPGPRSEVLSPAAILPPLDPVTLVAIPPKDSAAAVSGAAMRSHLAVARRISDGLSDPATDLPSGLSFCLSEMSRMTPDEHIQHQRDRLAELIRASSQLEAADRDVIALAPGSVGAVLSSASPGGLRVSLIERYLRMISHPDEDLPRDLREGFPLVGDIPVSPIAPPATVRTARISPAELLDEAAALAPRLLQQHASPPRDASALEAEREIFSQTQADIALGRMGPLRAPQGEGVNPPFTRRFGVSQTSSHGKTKLRCIDDFAQSLVNDSVSVSRRIRMGKISDLVEAAKRLRLSHPEEPLHVLKSDFQAAYRSCPIRPDHVPLANILVRDPDSGSLHVSAQYAMPFGAVSAVYAWDRLGEALTAILREVFLFPASRYVDDLFMAVWAQHSAESRDILLQVVSLFGAVLSREKTPEPCACVPVLGVLVSIEPDSVRLSIEGERIRFWLSELSRLEGTGGLQRQHLACRMAGRLEFAAAAAWGVLPRSHFNGLYQLSGGATLDGRVSADLSWLLCLMTEAPPSRVIFLSPRKDPPLILYTDASGSPANGLGAVLVDGEEVLWTSCRCPDRVLGLFRQRKTQINLLEVCGVILGLWTFSARVRHRRLVVFVDNQAALGAIRKGRSPVADLNVLVSVSRELLTGCSSEPIFLWVPSELNWADAPSRGSKPLAGLWVAPVTRWQTISKLIS